MRPASTEMITHLQTLQRWWARISLPFVRWRVPVQLLRGKARGSDREVTLLTAGPPRWNEFVLQQWFAGEPLVEKSALVPVWMLQRLLDEWQPAADLTHIGMDRSSAWLFLRRRDCLAMPPIIGSWLSVPANLPPGQSRRSRLASDFRRVKKRGFKSHLSREAGEFDLFYDHFYKPHVLSRHQESARIPPRWMMRLVFHFGVLQWLTLDGEKVAGDLVAVQGRDFIPMATGVHEGRDDLLRQGSLAALYVYSLESARRLGCTRVLLGGSLSCLRDGVLRYKAKWQDGLLKHGGSPSANHVLLLRWNRLEGAVADFLCRTGLVHHDQSGYSALWAFPIHLPLTAENLRKQYEALKLKGLHRFRILLPDKAPADFVCPPEVRLIEMAAAEKAGAGGIGDLG